MIKFFSRVKREADRAAGGVDGHFSAIPDPFSSIFACVEGQSHVLAYMTQLESIKCDICLGFGHLPQLCPTKKALDSQARKTNEVM